MEHCVKDQILSFLLENNLLSKFQHGFLPGRSTITELLECVNEWSLAIESGDAVDCVFQDLRKAFDSVVHSKWAPALPLSNGTVANPCS